MTHSCCCHHSFLFGIHSKFCIRYTQMLVSQKKIFGKFTLLSRFSPTNLQRLLGSLCLHSTKNRFTVTVVNISTLGVFHRKIFSYQPQKKWNFRQRKLFKRAKIWYIESGSISMEILTGPDTANNFRFYTLTVWGQKSYVQNDEFHWIYVLRKCTLSTICLNPLQLNSFSRSLNRTTLLVWRDVCGRVDDWKFASYTSHSAHYKFIMLIDWYE